MMERVPSEHAAEIDDISIESSESEAYSSDQAFLVERILAERPGSDYRDGKKRFLILWAEYPPEKATWEPRENIQDLEILSAWKVRKEDEEEGREVPFDVTEFENRLEVALRAKEDKYRRRKAKRKRLGMPVSPDHDTFRRADESDSTQAEESDGVSSMKQRFNSLNKGKSSISSSKVRYSGDQNRPIKRRASKQVISDESDGSDESNRSHGTGTSEDSLILDLRAAKDGKRTKKKLVRPPRDQRPAQVPAKSPTSQDKPVLKKFVANSSRARPSSSPSEVPLSELREQRRQSQQRSESTDTAISKQLASTSRVQPRATSAGMSRTVATGARGLPAVRGSSTSSRGRGATRGGSSTNVFQLKAARRKRPTLIENAADMSKAAKHFPNWHIQRKAYLAGRGLADVAPDLTALGGLFRPSDPSALEPLRPADLRRDNFPADQQPLQTDLSNNIFVGQSPPRSTRAWDPTWDKNSVSQHDGSNHLSGRPQYDQDRHGLSAICHFWKSNGNCSKGYLCDFSHTDDAHLPIGPVPHSSGKMRPLAMAHESSATSTDPHTKLWPNSDGVSHKRGMICFFWHALKKCSKGQDCNYSHTYDGNLPIAPDPRTLQSQFGGLQAVSAHHPSLPTPAILPSITSQPTMPLQHSPPLSARGVSRPPYNPDDPYKAICFFWNRNLGYCNRGQDCWWIHDENINLPVAPSPPGPLPRERGEVCKYWAGGYCEKPDHICIYLHGDAAAPPQRSVPSTIDELMTESNLVRISDASEVAAEPGRGYASTFIPTGPLNYDANRKARFDRPCLEWLQGRCSSSSCRYWHSKDGSDKIQPRPSGPKRNVSTDLNTPDSRRGKHVTFAESSSIPDPSHEESSFHPSAQNSELVPQPESTQSRNNQGTTNSGEVQFQEREPRVRFTEEEIAGAPSPVIAKSTAPVKAKAGISMEDYTRNEAIKSLGDRAKTVAFGEDETKSVLTDVGDLTQAKLQHWGKAFSTLNTLHFTRTCLAQDFREQVEPLMTRKLWHGSLGQTDESSSHTLANAFEHLRLSSSGFLCICDAFVVLVYPGIEEWRFIEGDATFSPKIRLRYLVFQSELDFSLVPAKSFSRNLAPYRPNLMKTIHGLNFNSFIPKLQKNLTYHFYLLFPSSANKTAEILVSWLRECSKQVKIYSSQTAGSWDTIIREKGIHAGCVLIHESAIASVCELPSLRSLVVDKLFTFWYIADGTAKYPMYGPPVGSSSGQITTIRLLPHGHAFFLTPSFLVGEPDKALDLVNWFLRGIKHPEAGAAGSWKMVCAHNIRDYLLDIAIEKAAEKDDFQLKYQGDPQRDALMEEKGISYLMCQKRFELHAILVGALSEPGIFSDQDPDTPDEMFSPIIYASELVDANDEQALVTWFAGWAMCRLDQFRKFTVVGSNAKHIKRATRDRLVVSKPVDEPPSTNIYKPDTHSSGASSVYMGATNKTPGTVAAHRIILEVGSTYIAQSYQVKSNSMSLRFNLNDKIRVTNFVSGVTWMGTNQRTNQSGHFTAGIFSPANTSSGLTSTSSEAPNSKQSVEHQNVANEIVEAERPWTVAKARAGAIAEKLNASTPTTPSVLNLDRSSFGSLGGYTVIRPLDQIIGSMGGHAVTQPLQSSKSPPPHFGGHHKTQAHQGSPTSPANSDSDVEMSIDSGPTVPRTKHGIDQQASPDALQFIVLTGSNLETAKSYLSRSNYVLQIAVNAHATDNGSLAQLDAADDSVDIDQQLFLAFEEVRGRGPRTESYTTHYDNDRAPQLDGLSDVRPTTSGGHSASSSRSGILTDDNGRRTVPASICASGSTRPHLSIQPGFDLDENREFYQNPHRRTVNEHNLNSSAPEDLGLCSVAENGDAMDIDMSVVDERGSADTILETKEIRYEPTMAWYTRLYKEGKGWEHIYVESSPLALKSLDYKG